MKFFNLVGKTVSRYWYLVIAFWLAVTAALYFAAPNLSDLLSADQGDLLPKDSPSVEAKRVIEKYFNNNEYKSTAMIVIEDANGLNAGDREYARELTKWLDSKEKPAEISKVLSVSTNPDLADVLDSKDKKATVIVIGFKTESAAPLTYAAIDKVKEHIKNPPQGLKLYVTGEAAIINDYDVASKNAADSTTIITVLLVVAILLVIYRSPIAPLIPLVTIGISFSVAKSLVAFMAQQGMKIADFTEIFMVVILFGAGTDYCLFILSRYKEELAGGLKPSDAVVQAVTSVGEAISSSAATVIVGMAAMAFAQFGMFNKTGPSLAIAVGVSLIAGLTLTPALMRLFGKLTFCPVKKIHHLKESQVWDKISGIINRRPGIVFATTVLIMGAFALLSLNKTTSYDIFSELPGNLQSVKGYEIFKKHYQQGEMLPVTVVIKAKDDMWSPNSLNNIYLLTKELEKLKFVDSVRSAAQPNGNGKDFEGFLIPNQLMQVSGGLNKLRDAGSQLQNGLRQASEGVESGRQGTAALKSGAQQIAGGLQTNKSSLGQISSGVGQIKSGIDGLNQTLAGVSNQLGATGAILAGKYPTDPDVANIFYQKGVIDAWLNGTNGVPKISDLSKGLADSKNGLDALAVGQDQMISGQNQIIGGLDQAASGSAQLRDSLNKMSDGAGSMTEGLRQSKDAIDKMSKSQKDNGAGFFYVPGEIIEQNPTLKEGIQEYISRDSKATKIDINLKDMPYSDAAIKDVEQLEKVLRNWADKSNFNTPKVYIGGANALTTDMKHLIDSDFNRLVYLVVIGVFIILILLMRGVISPIYLVLTILLSYVTTTGITVLLFKNLLGQSGLDWKVPVFMFIMLVALGEDYNILLMSRVKEETSAYGVSDGVRRAVRKTGGIITSAGIIMAGTFATLMFTSLMSMVQLGFSVAFGILLDTFVVRPILVPSIILLLDKLAVRLHIKPANATITN